MERKWKAKTLVSQVDDGLIGKAKAVFIGKPKRGFTGVFPVVERSAKLVLLALFFSNIPNKIFHCIF